MADLKLRLKLSIDTKAKKVLFAEAGNDIVGDLFYFLSLPVGSVVRFLKEKGVASGLADHYESFESLDGFTSGKNRDLLINPRGLLNPTDIPLFVSYE
ncbi:hypothetical protein Ddye_028533 [Dipteronia dyeriana]|uniref:Uncharacterized protein n=1 Tax=Dipteronia dyeriana TaxID=168575 RepID=A0AAD9TDI9_9ROSI|nr:hypothetical protein Ddye_028533 [Dipteronia dyeriana]